ncbi:Hypothetical predicted protein [Pelobates cultripes]|uniref:Endonuclease/exonuclease/phosphatase domain-containing protein n=1 Tax=Pelobates cultripes TaxID=61616 RepID=A0AAD1RCD2_PELCU|nr:Hypothetical predicted protein [Pelobates cultripes]
MLQETHFRSGATPTLQNKSYPTNHFCNHPTARKAGVAILLSTELEFQVLDTVTDTQGRYLFLKGTIAGKLYTFANIYVTNKRQAMFLKSTLAKLNDFSEGILVLGVDFNVPLDPILDSSTGHSSISQLHL